MKKKKDNKYVVYLHTLKSDGRKYVGITCQNPEKRWKNGRGYTHNSYFANTIQKYGWDTFKHEIVFENLTEDQACLKEKALIKLFNTTDRDYGFNLTSGGEHYEAAEIVKQKISVANTKYQISYELLYNLYIVQNKTQQECANHFGCCKPVITKQLRKFGITKNKYQAWYQSLNIPEEELKYQYVTLHKTVTECAQYFRCGCDTLLRYLKKYGLIKENRYEITKEALYDYYVNLNKSAQECADYFGCSVSCIRSYLYKFKITKAEKTELTKMQIQNLYEYYCIMGYSVRKCAKLFNMAGKTMKITLIKYNIMEGGF